MGAVMINKMAQLINKLAYKYARPGVDQEDLKQAGRMGAIIAERTYNPEAGTKLETWAYLCILREVSREARRWYKSAAHEVENALVVPASDDWDDDGPDLCEAWSELSAEEQAIISRRAKGETFRDIGEHFGYSYETARQKYKAAVEYLVRRL